MALGGAGTGAEHCCSIKCARSQQQLSDPHAPSSKHWDLSRSRRNGGLTVLGQGDDRREGGSDWSIREEPFQGTSVAVLLGDFLFIYLLFRRIIRHSISVSLR